MISLTQLMLLKSLVAEQVAAVHQLCLMVGSMIQMR
jgi:hypothetical protein